MGLLRKILGTEGKAKVVIHGQDGREVKYVDMSMYHDVYELMREEIRSNPQSRKIDVSYGGESIRVSSH